MSLAALSVPNPPIGAISANITFPFGVTVATDPSDPHQAAAGVVQLSPIPANGGSLVFARYSAATASSKGKLKFQVDDGNGFSVNQQITLTLGITPGYVPLESQFGIENSLFWDIHGVLLSGITPTLTTQIQ
jgi:hypothetical protein